MPRIAILSDIHGNLAALEAVLRDVETQKPDRIVCLGDTAGYGPFPRECFARVHEVAALVLAGNLTQAALRALPVREETRAFFADRLERGE